MSMEGKAVAMFLRPLASLLVARNIAPEPIFSQFGISLADTRNTEAMVDTTKSYALLDEVERLLDDPSLGINMARESEYSTFGGLGLALSAGGSLLSVLQRIVRFHRLISNVVNLELDIETDRVAIRFVPNDGFEPHHQGIQFVMASLVRMVRIRIDAKLNPIEVHAPAISELFLDRMSRYFRVKVQAADHFTLVFARHAVNAELQSSEPQMAAMLDATLSERLAQQEKGSLVIQLSLWVEGQLPEGEPSLTDAAEQFHMSVRSLQRRLTEEDLTWQKLLERTRRTLVERHLRIPGTSVTQLAFLLGFSDVSAFSRAFKKWYGVSPSQFNKPSE